MTIRAQSSRCSRPGAVSREGAGMMDAAALFTAYLRYMPSDFAAWRALFAEDAVMELPFHPEIIAGEDAETRIEGADNIATIIKQSFLDNLHGFKLDLKALFRVEGEDAVIGEYTGTADVVTTGRRYKQDYIAYLRAENGKIAVFREYMNGERIVAAFDL